MISNIVALALAAGAAHAAVVPTAPGPGQSFNEGADCTLSWSLDTTGKWTSFNVDLMSGSNLDMQTVTNVFRGRDGTKGDNTFSWKCPQVNPNSAIYFYQFTQSGADTTWTTRFTIASPSGQVTSPANSTQPGGAAIPWGIGRLEGAGDPSTNSTVVTPTPGSNTTVLNTPTSTVNVTNIAAPPTGNNTASTTNNTAATTSTQQFASPPVSTPSTSQTKKGPTSNTASTSNTNLPPTSSDAVMLISSKAMIASLVTVSLFAVA